jgi:hypothetical protein
LGSDESRPNKLVDPMLEHPDGIDVDLQDPELQGVG